MEIALGNEVSRHRLFFSQREKPAYALGGLSRLTGTMPSRLRELSLKLIASLKTYSYIRKNS